MKITDEAHLCLTSHGVSVRADALKTVSQRMQKHEVMLADCHVAFKTTIEREYAVDVDFYDPGRIPFQIGCGQHASIETVR